MKCKICQAAVEPFAHADILGKYSARYFRCPNCEFVHVQDPFWLAEAYTAAISKTDVGLLSRNVMLCEQAKLIILAFFDHRAKFVDYGGGYGIFVRLMRDSGFDFSLYDKYCENLFATGLSVSNPTDKPYELLTAFEVLEHLPEPLAAIEEMRRYSSSILFTTTLIDSSPPQPRDWWYYGLEHGQHVSFYAEKTLRLIAEKYDVRWLSVGQTLHLFTPKPVSQTALRALLSRYVRPFASRWLGRRLHGRSLLPADYERLVHSSHR
jgi:hypothetical protein